MDNYQAHLPAVFAALSDPTRLAVVERLVRGPASVSELARPFDIAKPSFLKHLRVLEGAHIVSSRKKGRVRTVSLEPQALDWVEAWLGRHRRLWEARLDRLATVLEDTQK